MNKTFIVAKRDYVTNIRRKSFLAMMFGMPVLMLLIFGVQMYFSEMATPGIGAGAPAGLVDSSGLGVADSAASCAGDSCARFTVFASEEEMKGALLSGNISVGYVVPADYLSTGKVKLLVLKNALPSEDSSAVIRPALLSALAARLDPAIAARIVSPVSLDMVQISAGGEAGGMDFGKLAVGMIVGIILMFSLFFTSGFLLQSVVEEKENRMIEVLLSSISATELLAGKIIGLAALALTQMAVWFGGAAFLFIAVSGQFPQEMAMLNLASALDPFTLVIYALYFLGGFLLFSSVFAGIGALSTSQREGQQLTPILVLPAIAPLWFMVAFMSEPNGTIPTLFSLFPLSSPLAMILRINLADVPSWQIALSLLLLFASVAAAIWASAKVFRATILMYGKRPGLNEILLVLKSR